MCLVKSYEAYSRPQNLKQLSVNAKIVRFFHKIPVIYTVYAIKVTVKTSQLHMKFNQKYSRIHRIEQSFKKNYGNMSHQDPYAQEELSSYSPVTSIYFRFGCEMAPSLLSERSIVRILSACCEIYIYTSLFTKLWQHE